MTPLLVRTAAIACLALLSACSSLPPDMPDDFSVTVTQSGGMRPVSTEVTYAAAGCRYVQRRYGGQPAVTEITFMLDAAELRSLYRVLTDGRFDSITTHHEVIYDREGYRVAVTARGRTFILEAGGQAVVDVLWQPSWRKIFERLDALQAKAEAIGRTQGTSD